MRTYSSDRMMYMNDGMMYVNVGYEEARKTNLHILTE